MKILKLLHDVLHNYLQLLTEQLKESQDRQGLRGYYLIYGEQLDRISREYPVSNEDLLIASESVAEFLTRHRDLRLLEQRLRD